jgi:hypothetical protein
MGIARHMMDSLLGVQSAIRLCSLFTFHRLGTAMSSVTSLMVRSKLDADQPSRHVRRTS